MALLRTLGLNRPRYYEPKFRLGHYAGTVGGECFVFAGRTGDFLKTKEELSSTIEGTTGKGGTGKWKRKMEMETEMEKDVENGKGHQSDYIFNAMKLAK